MEGKKWKELIHSKPVKVSFCFALLFIVLISFSLSVLPIKHYSQDNGFLESEIQKLWAETQNGRKKYHGQERMGIRQTKPKSDKSLCPV